MRIGENIKRRRQELDMTLEDVARRVGVSRQTMSRYETGVIGNIPGEKIEALAGVLNTTPAFLMGWETASEAEPSPAVLPFPEEGISGKYYRLNDQGQLMAMDYVDFLLTRYALVPEETEALGTIRLYLHTPAAGYAAPVLDDDYVELPRTKEMPRGADYCVNISGDSMEPYLHDRQRIYVIRNARLEDGDVGLWAYRGEVFCKQVVEDPYGTVYLLSANPARQDANITVPPESVPELRCLGKVILPKKLPLPAR